MSRRQVSKATTKSAPPQPPIRQNDTERATNVRTRTVHTSTAISENNETADINVSGAHIIYVSRDTLYLDNLFRDIAKRVD